MLIALTTTQLRELSGGSGPLALLADILDSAKPGQPQTVRCPNAGRRAFGERLRALAEESLVAVDDPGSWQRVSYTVRALPNDIASWIQRSGALHHWRALYPQTYDTLRAERTDLDQRTFDSRFRAGVANALNADEIPSTILPWLQRALNYAAPAHVHEPSAPRESEQTQLPQKTIRALRKSCPNYDRIANFEDVGDEEA